MRDRAVPALCQSCGRRGRMPVRIDVKPRWCQCTGRKPGGPYVAPPGVVVVYRFESREDASFREACLLLSNAERHARDDLSQRWVRSGRGYRELPKSSPKRRRLEAAYCKTLRALERIQAQCSHPERSMYAPEWCGVCYAQVQSDIAVHRAWEASEAG